MTEHYRWETTLDQRRRTDPGIDGPGRQAAARGLRNARDIGYHLAQLRRHLRLAADFGQATTTFIDYTDALTA